MFFFKRKEKKKRDLDVCDHEWHCDKCFRKSSLYRQLLAKLYRYIMELEEYLDEQNCTKRFEHRVPTRREETN